MKIKPYVEKLEDSGEFRTFMNKYPQSYITAGFFILDFESGKNVHQIDFYVPNEKKIAAFTLDQKVTLQLLDLMNSKMIPEKLDLKTNIDLDALQGILTDEMRNRGMSENIRKIIAVIQTVNGKKIWNLNCILTGMEILNSHIEDESKTVLRIEKTSMLDLMKKIPMKDLKNMQQPKTEGDVKTEIKNLEKLQSEIEKEKEKLKTSLDKKAKTKAKD